MSIREKAQSPCVGVCSTGVGDSVCRGCKRYMHEVVDWNSYSNTERLAVLGRISALARQVVAPIIHIADEKKLADSLSYQNIRHDENVDPHVWVIELLKVGASRIDDLKYYGCRVQHPYASVALTDIREQIDNDFFTLSQVHYDRYFAQNALSTT